MGGVWAVVELASLTRENRGEAAAACLLQIREILREGGPIGTRKDHGPGSASDYASGLRPVPSGSTVDAV